MEGHECGRTSRQFHLPPSFVCISTEVGFFFILKESRSTSFAPVEHRGDFQNVSTTVPVCRVNRGDSKPQVPVPTPDPTSSSTTLGNHDHVSYGTSPHDLSCLSDLYRNPYTTLPVHRTCTIPHSPARPFLSVGPSRPVDPVHLFSPERGPNTQEPTT